MKDSNYPSKKRFRKPKSIGGLILLILVAFIYNTFFTEEEVVHEGDLIPVEFVRTIDGDTIKVRYEGKEQNVRYLLIDTPEMNDPKNGEEPFAQEATDRNDELLRQGQVQLEFDVGDRYDRYDRLLAYIYVDGESVQEKLLEEGLARVAYVYPPNTRHVEKYEKIEEKAERAKIGIWSIKDYVTNRGFNPPN